MAEQLSNVNLNNIGMYGNTGVNKTYLEPALIRAIVLVPKGTVIPKGSMANTDAFKTYCDGKFMADTRASRWFAFTNLDDFKDNTKKPSSEDTGLIQTEIMKYAPTFGFRYLRGMGDFIEALAFHNMQAFFDVFFIDANGSWQGRMDPTGGGGLASYSLQQLFIMDRGLVTDKAANHYTINVHLSDRKQMNENFRYYAAGTDIDSIQMPENAVLMDVTGILGTPLAVTATTDMVVTLKAGQDSDDLVARYMQVLTASCFTAYDLTTGASITAPTIKQKGTIIVAGQTYSYVWLRFASGPGAGHTVQVSLAAPSVVNAIIPGLNCVTEIVQPGVNGANVAVATF